VHFDHKNVLPKWLRRKGRGAPENETHIQRQTGTGTIVSLNVKRCTRFDLQRIQKMTLKDKATESMGSHIAAQKGIKKNVVGGGGRPLEQGRSASQLLKSFSL